MIRNRNRWLATILAIAIALGDCGGMTALATESGTNAENTVSENNTSSDESPENEAGENEGNGSLSDSYDENISSEESDDPPDEDVSMETDKTGQTEETDTEVKLPALHIGQIPEGETLPSADDDAFSYDLPISFEAAENLILFVNYDVEPAPEYREAGILEWHILRGEKGLEPGSTNLLNEADDWNGFEEVSASPFFVMEEITDEESAYEQMILLSSTKTFSHVNGAENYETSNMSEYFDYYIRAAYYPETENGKAENFYAAATVPFAPQNNPDTDTEQITEAPIAVEEITADTENTASSVSENSSISENNIHTTDDTLSGNDLAMSDTPSAAEDNATDPPEDTYLENAGTEPSTVSENNSAESLIMSAENDAAANSDLPPLEKPWNGKISLYKGTTAVEENILAEKEQITMSLEDTQQITAKTESAMTQADIVWESSDETVATVNAAGNGTATITASAEGFARITASCQGITASAIVDVVHDKNNSDNDKLLDLSGDIRVAGFVKESDELVYNGQKITQSFRVYHKDTLLKEKTDYTLTYKNNVNAATWNAAKAPSVTIKLKGQYQGSVTLYYTIKPLDINNIDIYNTPKVSPAYEQTVNYSKKLNIPAPVLTYGKKKLAVNKDFVCDYTKPGEGLTPLPTDYKNGDLYEAGKTYSYTVNGTGNFKGSFLMQLVVLKDKKRNFSSASVKLDQKQYEYHGMALDESAVKIIEVKISGQIVEPAHYDYKVYASGMEGAYVMVSPSSAGKAAGYSGCKKITLKLVGDRQLKDAAPGADWKDSIPFSQKIVDKNGGIFQSGSSLITYENTPLTEGTDYTVKYGNAKKAGKVTATFTGKGRYKGTLRLSYTITPNTDIKIYPGKNVDDQNGTYEVAYQKDGAVPELILKDADYTVLKNKTDYTIKYKDNKTPGTTMTCEITGKGNYKGYVRTVSLMVTNGDIGKCTISIPDKPYSDKPNKWKSTVTVKDVNGKKLTAGKDYDKNFTYSHTQEQSPPAGTTVEVTVTGLGCYEGSVIKGTYRIFAKNISVLKVVIDPQEYTGEEVLLNQNNDKRDIHIYANNADAKKKQNEITSSCYEIIGYTNNVKAGTAKVTLHGIGEYGGTKTYAFKIQKKQYLINHVKGIALNKTSLSLSLAEPNEEIRTLTATLTAETDKMIANPTVVWTSSNSNIVSVEEKPASATQGLADTPRTVSASAVLTLKKEGSVTITATAQDSGKKAQCKVTVVDAPVLLEAGQTIKENIGNTYQLHIKFAPTQDSANLKWESNNPDAVSVAKNEEGAVLTMKKTGAAVIKAVYTSGKKTFTQQCYAVAVDPNEKAPETTGALLTYKQQDGVTDDTPYINKMLRDYEWGDETHVREVTLYIPAGVYHIDATAGGNDSLGNYKFGGIVLTTNQKLVMSPSALLVALPNNKKNYQVINITGRDGVSVSGGQIIGERKEHNGSGGEWGHGIYVAGSTNITIDNVDISQCWGDGIYLGFYDGPNKSSNGVTITNCNLHHNRRNNLSITDVSNVTVNNCEFNYASGADPQYGIDIEPNKNRTCSNVTISNSRFKGNAKGTIQILGQLNAHVKGVTIENCTGDKEPLIWQGYGGSVSGVTQKGNKWG